MANFVIELLRGEQTMAEYKVGDRVGAKVYDYDYNKHLVIGTITKIDGKMLHFRQRR